MSFESSPSLEDSIRQILIEVGENPNRPGLDESPMRFSRALQYSLSGYSIKPEKFVKLFDNDYFKGLVTVSQIEFSSLCEHHLLPFFGRIDIAYVPGKQILGLSKFARIADVFSKRLQVQERLTQELAEFLFLHVRPEILIVKIEAVHTCMSTRGVNKHRSTTTTLVALGKTEEFQHEIDYFNINTSNIS